MDFNLYVEVKDLIEDDDGNKCPAGVKICLAKNLTQDAYDKMFSALSEMEAKKLVAGLNLFGDNEIKIIAQEEYERSYGDDE